MKTKVVDYNKGKAKVIFAALKFSEIFAVFLFFFGFNWLGKIGYDLIIKHIVEDAPTTYMEFWMCGLLTMLILLVGIALLVGTLVGAFYLVKTWLASNWRWSKILAEDESSKIKRLKEKEKITKYGEVYSKEKERSELGYCTGDTAKAIEDEYDNGTLALKKNKKYDIISVSGKWIRVTDESGYTNGWSKSSFKVYNKKLDKKPKLNMKFVVQKDGE